jgi:hypothetical protein
MSFATEHAVFDPLAHSEGELGQRQPSSSSANPEETSPEQLSQAKGLHSEQDKLEVISPLEGPLNSSEPSPGLHNAPPTKVASVALVSLRRSSSASRSSMQSPNVDNPFALFETAEELDRVLRYFASNHGLMKALHVIEQAAHAERDEMEAFHDFPLEERTAMEEEREAPFSHQSRSLKGAVLVVGTLSGMCQGWAQSVLNGSGRNPKEKMSRDSPTLT